MFTFSAETRIDRDPETVARFLADPYRYGEWTDMHDVRVLTEGPPRAGARVQATIGSGVMKVRLTWELSAFEPARLVSYRTVSDGRLGIDASYRLDALPDGGTRLRVDGSVRLHGLLRLVEPVLRAEMRRGEARELERARAVLETETASADGRAAAAA